MVVADSVIRLFSQYLTVGKPMKLSGLDDVTHVAAGLRHVLVLTKDGRVMACGCGSKGQLGILDDSRLPLKELEEFREGKPSPFT